MEVLKEKLLKTGYFIDNEYLDKYIKLCMDNKNIKYNIGLETHHIIPFAYFILNNNLSKKEKDKLRKKSMRQNTEEYTKITKNNIVYLTFYNHCLAHYFLFRCTITKLQQANEHAFCKMIDRNLELRGCSEKEIKELLDYVTIIRQIPESDLFKALKIKEYIEKYYNIGGYLLVQTKLKDECNIKINKSNIKAKARLLNITGAKYTEPWTEEELEIIKIYYAKFGYKKCKELLPNRSKDAIQTRAKYLNIIAPGANKINSAWENYEIELVKQYYPIGGVKLVKKYLPNRTESAIKHQAAKQNVVVIK